MVLQLTASHTNCYLRGYNYWHYTHYFFLHFVLGQKYHRDDLDSSRKITNTSWISGWPIYDVDTALGAYKNEQRTSRPKHNPSTRAKLPKSRIHTHSARSGRLRSSDQRTTQEQDLFLETPTQCIRAAERQLNIPISSIQRILRQRIQLLPYLITNHQTLTGSSWNRRLQFVQLVLQKRPTPERYLYRFFSDEKSFPLTRPINSQNSRYWGKIRPNLVNEVSRGGQNVMVWSITSNRIINGPHFFSETTISRETYRNMQTFGAMEFVEFFFVSRANYLC